MEAPTNRAQRPEPEELLELCWRFAADKKALEPVALDLRGVAGFADYFLIVSGTSEPHLKAIAEAIAKGLKELGILPRALEGIPSSHWIVLDYGDVVIHAFHPSTRRYYALEQLWNDATPMPLASPQEQGRAG